MSAALSHAYCISSCIQTSIPEQTEWSLTSLTVTCQDVGQFFGRLASWIARHQRLETPAQFVAVINNFLKTLTGRPWPAQGRMRALLLTQMRGWSAWLAKCSMTLQGHTGPSAPHVLSFRRRNACSATDCHDLLEHPECSNTAQQNDCDMVLFCKQWLSSPLLSQPPLVVFRASVLNDLEVELPAVSTERKPMTKKYIAHVQKFVPLMTSAPYCMAEAAAYLAARVVGTAPRAPLLDVSSCSLQHASLVAAAEVVRQSGVDPTPIPEGGEGDLDPAAGVVVLAPVAPRHGPPERGALQQASVLDERYTLVYTCAIALFQHQRMSMVDAVTMGEKCWQEFVASSAKEQSASAQGGEDTHRPRREGGHRPRRAGGARGGNAGGAFAADLPDGSDGEARGVGVLDIMGMGDALDLDP